MNKIFYYILDDAKKQLLIIDFKRSLAYNIIYITIHFFENKGLIMGYLSLRQTAEKWGLSIRRVQTLCSTERIPGATKIGFYWAIPEDAERPKDARVKSGRYIKKKR